MKAIGIDDEQILNSQKEAEDDRSKTRPTQATNPTNSNFNTNMS